MTTLTWNHACSVGVRAINDQHGILMDALNELRDAAGRGGGREQVSELLDRLIEFTRMHFASEEQLMQRSGFPGLEEHRKQHQRLMAQILEAAHRLQHGEHAAIGSLVSFLGAWHVKHTELLDRPCAAWLNEQGTQ